MSLYVRISREIRRVMRDFSPTVEPLSIDEAFIDLSGIAGSLDQGAETAAKLKQRIRDEQSLTASAGVAPNKFLAKIASDMEKPDGLVVFPLSDVPARLWPMPVERLWGVGPKTAARLHDGGLRTVGSLVEIAEADLELLVGRASAHHLQAIARGEDHRSVRTERVAKSISEERTYGTDLTDPDEIDRAMLGRASGVARQLRREGLVGRTVQIKVRTADFTTWTRSHTLACPTDLTEPIVEAARMLFRERIPLKGRGVRLLGVGISGLEPQGAGQATLFTEPAEHRARLRAQAADAVRNRLGERAIMRARLIDRPDGGEEDDDDRPQEASSLPSVD